MPSRDPDIFPIRETRVRLTASVEDVAGSGSEKASARNGASAAALVDVRRPDHDHTLASEHASLVLAEDAMTGLRQAMARHFVSDEELDRALGSASAP
ncbi:MAG TPA: hypothetical protein VF467_00155 [Afipia sp.]